MIARDLAIGLSIIGASAVAMLLAVTQVHAQQPSALEEARLSLIAARQEILRLQGEKALAEQKLGECAGQRGQLELLVSKAVIDSHMAAFVTDYEAAHPGMTWSFEQRGPVKKAK